MIDKQRIVKPELPGGFRDYPPAAMIFRQQIIDTIRQVYESFGFLPLETPGVEKLEVITGGNEDFNKSIFVAKVIKGLEDRQNQEKWDETYALRFDLTVPLARFVAQNPDLPKPFKRYQMGSVWRGEKPQKGRFREFTQFDFDIIGSNSLLADTEVIQVMHAVMTKFGLPFTIRFNSRKILDGLAEVIGCQSKAKELFRILDKLDKIGWDSVSRELQRLPDNQFDESALALSSEVVAEVERFLTIQKSNDQPEEILASLQDFFQARSIIGLAGTAELLEIVKNLQELSLRNWQIDLSVARGLDYYNGPVFETELDDFPQLGSVLSGGRFDGLTNRFVADSNVPGVGASVGLDRLLVALEEAKKIPTVSLTKVLVTIFSDDLNLKAASLSFAAELRKVGINAELYLADGEKLREQITYALRLEIPYVAIIGPEEYQKGRVCLKYLPSRTQEVVTLDRAIKQLLVT